MLIPSLNPKLPSNLREADGKRYETVYARFMARETLSPDDQQFLNEILDTVNAGRDSLLRRTLIVVIYTVLIACTIGLAKQKRGLHDVLCGTRGLDGSMKRSV